jgi:hypothetical protein
VELVNFKVKQLKYVKHIKFYYLSSGNRFKTVKSIPQDYYYTRTRPYGLIQPIANKPGNC